MRSCDLCGATAMTMLVQPPVERAMRSDRQVVATRLAKTRCDCCGLVADATIMTTAPTYYRDDYQLDAGDHVFHASTGPVRRSEVMADWVMEAMRMTGAPAPAARLLEIGAGRGFLLAEMQRRLQGIRCEGLELSGAAAAEARARNLAVTQQSTEALGSAQYDIVMAVAVLEHVSSPTEFLREVHRLLKPGGIAILIQPTQDVPSYDVFFVDHLHHFGTRHLAAYAAKIGFDERYSRVGYRLMPNFSGHLWIAETPGDWSWAEPPASTTCRATLERVIGDMAALDRAAAALAARSNRFAVFGLHEVFALARTYSSIESVGIHCGLDDQPGRTECLQLPFPVMKPEDCPRTGVRDVFLTMNRIYYDDATERLKRLGLVGHPVLS